MAKIKVHAANFPYVELNASGGCLFIKTGLMQLLGETVHGSKISTIDIATEDTVQKVGGTIGWGVVGGVIAGPLGIIAGAVLGGRKKEVTFVVEIDDGRKFMGTTDLKTFTGLQSAAMKF